MINFDLTTEQKQIQETAFKFATTEMQPKAALYDEQEKMPLDIMQKAWELGLINTCIPAEYGGVGFNAIDSVIINECLSYGCPGMNTAIMANDLALLPIVLSGKKELIERFAAPFTQQFKVAAFCLTEPNNGSDAAGIKTKITETKDGYVINGDKMWITNAGYADIFVVYGTFDPQLKHKGIGAVVIEKNTPGLMVGKPEHKMGHRCSDTRGITFKDVKIPKENLIAGQGEGWSLAMKTLDHSRPMVAASAVGGAQCSLDHAVKYAKERMQFGKSLSQHQIIQQMIADMYIKVEASRTLVHKAAWLLSENKSNTLVASSAKALASDAFMQVATDAVQIYGGYGYSKEYPVEKLMRDAKLIQIYEGTSQIQRLVISREVLQ